MLCVFLFKLLSLPLVMQMNQTVSVTLADRGGAGVGKRGDSRQSLA